MISSRGVVGSRSRLRGRAERAIDEHPARMTRGAARRASRPRSSSARRGELADRLEHPVAVRSARVGAPAERGSCRAARRACRGRRRRPPPRLRACSRRGRSRGSRTGSARRARGDRATRRSSPAASRGADPRRAAPAGRADPRGARGSPRACSRRVRAAASSSASGSRSRRSQSSSPSCVGSIAASTRCARSTKKVDRLLEHERRKVEPRLGGDVQRLAARDEEPESRARRNERRERRCHAPGGAARRCRAAGACAARRPVRRSPPADAPSAPRASAIAGSTSAGSRSARERDEDRAAVGVLREQAGQLDREAGLARAAGPDDRSGSAAPR